MNDLMILCGMFGACIGMLGGYVLKHIQDTRIIKSIQKVNDNLVDTIKDKYQRREQCYRNEINRLSALMGMASIPAAPAEAPQKTKVADFVEIDMSFDSVDSLDFPNGGAYGR